MTYLTPERKMCRCNNSRAVLGKAFGYESDMTRM
jgi:hypothetical protein